MFAWQREVISAVLFLGALVSVGLAGFASSGSKKDSARPFALFQLAVFAWCFFDYLHLRLVRPSEQYLYFRLSFLGVLIVPPAAFAFGRTLMDRALGLRAVLLLCVVPALTLVLIWPWDSSGIFWRPAMSASGFALVLGPGYWIQVLYSYAIAGQFFLLAHRRQRTAHGTSRRWLRHAMLLLVFPLAANLVHLFGILRTATPGSPLGVLSLSRDSGMSPIDPTPVAFAIAGVFIALALRRYNILDTVPFAKDIVFEAIKDPIVTVDAEGRILGLNHEASSLFPGPASREGSLLPDLCPPSKPVLSGGSVEWRTAEAVFNIIVRPLKARFLSLPGSIVIFHDVTERARAFDTLEEHEETLRHFSFMANASRDLMSLVDRDLRHEAVNEAFCASFGQARGSLVGHPVAEAWAGSASLDRILAGFEACFRGQASILRLRHDFMDGRGERDLEFSFNPSRSVSGEPDHAVLVTKDVTDYLETQRQLSAARERADAANAAKGSFLAAMSHEIRTPLNAIIGLTELTLRSSLEEEQRDNLETVLAAGHNLLDLINDILDLSKIEAGQMTIERVDFDLPAQVAAVLKTFRIAAGQKGLSLDLVEEKGAPREVAGDPVKLGQIVTNLVGNAIKFTQKGGVTVTLAPLPFRARPNSLPGSRLRGEDPRVLGLRVSVRDTGIGIPVDQQKLIFESFSQADPSVSRRYGGTGLGLSICRQLAGLFGGEISVSSKPGLGSEFTLTAFFEPGDPARVQRRPLVEGPLSLDGRRSLEILVIEDNPVNAKVAVRWLTQEGHRARHAASGLEAFAILAEKAFDLILLDIEMPDIDGIEVARRIRSGGVLGPSGISVPIVAMTAHSGIEAREAFSRAGMDDYVAKPVDFVELAATLSRVVRPATREFPHALVQLGASRASDPGKESLGAFISTAEPLRRLGGDGELYTEILSIFASGAPGRHSAFLAALGEETGDKLRRLAHSLRGSAKTIGADELAEVAASLEEALRDCPDTGVPWLTDGLRSLCNRVIVFLDGSAMAAGSMLPAGYKAPLDE